MELKIWLNGKLVDREDAKITVFDHGLLYGDGVFEGIRVYNSRVFELDAHIKRLYESAKAIRLDIPMSKDKLIKAVEKTTEANGVIDGYIRLVVTRGVGTLGLNPFICEVVMNIPSVSLHNAKVLLVILNGCSSYLFSFHHFMNIFR